MALKSSKAFGQRDDTRLRRAIVVAQFVITLVIISGALTVSRQLAYIQDKDLGFEQMGILQIDLPESEKNEVLGQEWLSNPSISALTFAIVPPMAEMGLGMAAYPFDCHPAAAENYLETYGLELLAGRGITSRWRFNLNALWNE